MNEENVVEIEVPSEEHEEATEEILQAIEESAVNEEFLANELSGDLVQSLAPLFESDTETVEVVSLEPRPFLTTPFDDYSVTEGFLLLLLVALFLSACVRVLKGGFYWL